MARHHPAVMDAAIALHKYGGHSIREAAKMTGMAKSTLFAEIQIRDQKELDDSLGQGTADSVQRAVDQIEKIRTNELRNLADALLSDLLQNTSGIEEKNS
jgi:transposase